MADELREAADAMKGMLDDPMAAPKPEEAQPEQQAEAPESAEAETENLEETQEQAEPQGEAETSEAEADEDATHEGAEQGAESYELGADELAGLLGLDEDKIVVSDDGHVSFTGQVDGEEINANLSDLLNAYQRDANLTNRSKAVAELEKVRTAEIQQFQAMAKQQAEKAAITLEAINNAYLTEFNSIDWAGLKAEDPAQWSAKTVEMQQKKTQLDNLITQTVQEIEQQQATVDNETQKMTAERIISEQEKMQTGFKALNVKVDDDLQKGVMTYLTDQFDPSEMKSLVDHRFMLMAFKAMQFDKGSKTAQSKRVRKIPKVLKSGQKPSKQAVKLHVDKKLRSNLKESGSLDDAAALLKGKL